MTRDDIYRVQHEAGSKMITAHHHWAVPMLHPLAPAKYAEAAQAYRRLADTIDAYTQAESWTLPQPPEVTP